MITIAFTIIFFDLDVSKQFSLFNEDYNISGFEVLARKRRDSSLNRMQKKISG